MSNLSFRRAVIALALGLILLSPWASASELRSRAHRSSPSVAQEVQGVFGQLWVILSGFLSKAGGSLDPNGFLGSQPTTSSSAVLCDAGASADPFGRCTNGH
jgi:hypothetical protein